MKVLFLQLPQLDNDARGPHENLPLAAAYLRYSLEKSAGAAGWEIDQLFGPAEDLDDRGLVAEIADRNPHFIACTLYLWNVERTLRVLKGVRRRLPGVRTVAGGPEVSRGHPFLLRSAVLDALVAGEGEGVFPRVLAALRDGRNPDCAAVAWREGGRLVWGRKVPPSLALAEMLPPPDSPLLKPDVSGVAYLETSRGCPLRCSFCRYAHFRRRRSFLEPAEVRLRVRALRAAGAREIRFIDPTFNGRPAFPELLAVLCRENRGGDLRFFAEVRADRIDGRQALLLAKARFSEVEVGVQSVNVRVLRAIRRPADIAALEQGVRRLLAEGIRVTLDVMYGLPGQTLEDFKDSVRWALQFEGAAVQGLQTLLLPGTELRDERRRLGIEAVSRPPYSVLKTPNFSEAELHAAEVFLEDALKAQSSCGTYTFAACRLPDLFPERVAVDLESDDPAAALAGRTSRRAVIIRAPHFWPMRLRLSRLVKEAVRREPHILWQFVLAVDREEPLDLLDGLIAELDRFPRHLLDRYGAVLFRGRRAARRVFLRLKQGRTFDPAWVEAAEDRLGAAFH